MTLAELYAEMRPELSRYFAKHAGADSAEDLLSQTFAQLVGYDRPTKNLVRVAAKRVLVDEIRLTANRPTPVGLEAEVLRAQGRFHEQWPAFDSTFDTAVRNLEDEELHAFILTDIRGLTVREAAAVTGSSKSEIARRREAAVTSIREEILSA